MTRQSFQNAGTTNRILIPAILFVIALGVRLFYLKEYQHNPLFDIFPDSLDHFNFDQSAISFSNGDLLARATNNNFSPLYKYFLGILYWLFGRNLELVYFVQFCMGAFSCVLLYRIGETLFGVKEGVFAALGLALYSTHIIYEGLILRAAFISFLGVLSFYLLLRLKEKPGKKPLFWATLVLSLFFQARPNTLLCMPLICIFLRREIFPALLTEKHSVHYRFFFGIIFASFIPLLIQCYLVHGKFIFFDASGPHTFISGNLAKYSGVGFDHEIVESYRNTHLMGYASNISFLSRYILENPIEFFLLYVRKLFFFLNDFEAPTNISVYIFRDFSNLLPALLNHYSLISSMALVGIAVSWRERKRFFLLFAYISSLSVAILLFLNEARYRIPVAPFFFLFAGKGMGEALMTLKKKNFRQLAIILIAFTSIFMALTEPKGVIRSRANDYGNLGNAHIALNQWSLAQGAFQTSVEINPNNAYGHINLGRVLAHLNKVSEAVIEFKRAIALDPQQWQPYLNLGILFSHAGRWSEAETHLMMAWNMSHYPAAAFHLGDLYGKMSRHGESIHFLEKFLTHEPNQINANFLLGVEYEMTGQTEKALSSFNRTTRLAPKHIQAWNNLGTIYSRLGHWTYAKKAFQYVLDIDPRFEAARTNLQAILSKVP